MTLSNKTDAFLLGKFSSFSWFVHLNQCWAKFDGINDIDANYSIEQWEILFIVSDADQAQAGCCDVTLLINIIGNIGGG